MQPARWFGVGAKGLDEGAGVRAAGEALLHVIAWTRGLGGFHNQTLVVLSVA